MGRNDFDRQKSSPAFDSENVLEVVLSLHRRVKALDDKVDAIQSLLASDTKEKDWYTVSEVAEVLGKAEFTVREWCRLGRVYASKRECGRGNCQEWIVSQEELQRIENEGLLPL